MKIAIIGLGGRGSVYAHYTNYYGSEVVAVVDPDMSKKTLAESFGVKKDNFYTDENEFFGKGKIADAVVISTMDTLHKRQAIKAIETGYDILLEKPIALTLDDCEEIRDCAEKHGKKVVVCHVLRYSPFYNEIKTIIDEKRFGDVVSLEMTEEIGYYHFAHSYVRGNWRNTTVSAPLILAKNSHDIDMICWLLGEKCESVSSVGALNVFKKENAPEGSAFHCVDCTVKDKCRYNCFEIYNNKEFEKVAGLCKHARLGNEVEEINASLSDKNNLYSRCVYHCDNDICDHQTVNLLFKGNITAQFKSIAFSRNIGRSIKIYFTDGILYGSDNGNLYYEYLSGEKGEIKIEYSSGGYGHHAGGDVEIMKKFIEYIGEGKKSRNITDIASSVAGHKICFLAEESRLNNGKTFNI